MSNFKQEIESINSLNFDDELLIKNINYLTEKNESFWDFKGSNTKELTHGYHSYPAMMIPQLARTFIQLTKEVSQVTNVFDPFMGSGTTLVEGVHDHLESYGNDLNPLSRLMSKVKSTPIDPIKLSEFISKWFNILGEEMVFFKEINFDVPNKPTFKNMEFWFKENIVNELQIIKNNIYQVQKEEDIKDFLWVAFSNTVRYVSNTRNSEFKLYRMTKENLEKWDPDVLMIFKKELTKNIEGNKNLWDSKIDVKSNIYNLDSMNLEEIPDEKFDLLITSPPYGDSRTTVAYGQFSRLSLQWLDLIDNKEIIQLDNDMLGGRMKSTTELRNLGSETLTNTITELLELDEKRGREVYKFYYDLKKTINEISRVMKENSYQYWVVGNRTVKGNILPTHQIITELFEQSNVKLVTIFSRNIPNKRMPIINSPTNVKGEKAKTMTGEIILVFRKK